MHHHHRDLVSTASFSCPPGSVKNYTLGGPGCTSSRPDADSLTYQPLQTSLLRPESQEMMMMVKMMKRKTNQILVQKVRGYLMFSPMIPGKDLLQHKPG